MTNPQRFFRADITVYGPLTDAAVERLLGLLAAGCELAGAHVSGGFVETDAAGEDLEGNDDADSVSRLN